MGRTHYGLSPGESVLNTFDDLLAAEWDKNKIQLGEAGMRIEFYLDDADHDQEPLIMRIPGFIVPQIGSQVKVISGERPRRVRMVCHDLVDDPMQMQGLRIWLEKALPNPITV